MNKFTDKQLIEALGGSAEVARKLGIPSRHTVFAWTTRGIPSKYKVESHHRALWRKAEKMASSGCNAIYKEDKHGENNEF